MEIKFSNSLKGDSKPTDYANAIMNGVAVKPYFGGGYVPTSERVKVVDSPRLEYAQVDPQSYSDVINQVLADSKKPGYMKKLPSIEDYCQHSLFVFLQTFSFSFCVIVFLV